MPSGIVAEISKRESAESCLNTSFVPFDEKYNFYLAIFQKGKKEKGKKRKN